MCIYIYYDIYVCPYRYKILVITGKCVYIYLQICATTNSKCQASTLDLASRHRLEIFFQFVSVLDQ